MKALQQSEVRLTINNSDSISPFLSQEGAIKGNLTVHERQHLHHVPYTHLPGKLPSEAVLVGWCWGVCVTSILIINDTDALLAAWKQ